MVDDLAVCCTLSRCGLWARNAAGSRFRFPPFPLTFEGGEECKRNDFAACHDFLLWRRPVLCLPSLFEGSARDRSSCDAICDSFLSVALMVLALLSSYDALGLRSLVGILSNLSCAASLCVCPAFPKGMYPHTAFIAMIGFIRRPSLVNKCRISLRRGKCGPIHWFVICKRGYLPPPLRMIMM
ncbi:hypothetical protein M413DRAFT_271457 [Hebeloma cylindrosporum]|uniref:Uncharacterized protein n=1 Tax=Hebeloma cylindrosporum TaxID=76867 RepID=A0A0C3CTM8_HEBCY|nr:hypothetical protein M413DRAFT_271457 [Hebeloma cylindrosporum h7]